MRDPIVRSTVGVGALLGHLLDDVPVLHDLAVGQAPEVGDGQAPIAGLEMQVAMRDAESASAMIRLMSNRSGANCPRSHPTYPMKASCPWLASGFG